MDTEPATTLVPFSPDPTSQTALDYTGRATVVPYINQNPIGSNNDITLQTVTGVEYQVDSGPWLPASPVDGAFNGPDENFRFTTSALSTGTHTIQARAVNSVGNKDSTPASDTVTVNPGTYTLAVSKAGTGSGTVLSAPSGIDCGTDCSEPYASGTVVALSALPGASSTFAGWSGSCSGMEGCSVTMSSAQNVTATFDLITSPDVELTNAVPRTDTITATTRQGSWRYYWFDIASGSSNLVVDLYNLAADADLYVNYGGKPSLSAFNCRPYVGGLNSEQCTFTLPSAGRWWIGVNNWDTGTFSYTIRAQWTSPSAGSLMFYTVTPCRIIDTRDGTGIPLQSTEPRQIQVTGACGIPASAKAVSLNITVTAPSSSGVLTLYPSGAVVDTSSINFAKAQTRGNNAVLPLSADGFGTLAARAVVGSSNTGTVHLILDVNGYFQ